MVQGNHFSKLSAFVAVAEHGAAPQKRCSIRPVAQPGPTEDQMISPQPRSAPTRPDLSLVSSHQSVQNLRKRQLVHIVHLLREMMLRQLRVTRRPGRRRHRTKCRCALYVRGWSAPPAGWSEPMCGRTGRRIRTGGRPRLDQGRSIACRAGAMIGALVCSGHPRPRPSPQHGRNPDRAFVHSLWGRGMCAWPGGAGRRAERTDDATIHSDARSGAGIGHKTADQ
jgi:hypothetical protein